MIAILRARALRAALPFVLCAAPLPAAAQMATTLDVPMDRMGSGTSWIPEGAPLPSAHWMRGDWMLHLHGFVFPQFSMQGGPRGDEHFGIVNWGMLMASRPLGGGQLQARVMLSLDPLTIGGRGYPLLLQSGETHQGVPLVDRQHPHDFWKELAVLYERPITSSVAWHVYAGPSGEPALGPVAFMHRPSAMDDPTAPLGHHWQDATHISYGVVTAGLFGRRWRVEGSYFNGREPSEDRWWFDPIRLDSYAGRVTIQPSDRWGIAVGHGFLRSPEALHPDESAHRTTASLLHGRPFGADGQLAAALVWGANVHGDHLSHALLGEANLILDRRNTLFTRAELVQKTAGDLQLAGPGGFAADEHFTVGAVSMGYVRDVWAARGATVGIGGRGTVNFVPTGLEPHYGSRTPLGAVLYLRLRPSRPATTPSEEAHHDHH